MRAAIETEPGYDEVLWRQMARQLSLPGLALPEEYGGEGFGFTELQVVLEELGRALTPSPFFASVVLAAGTILAAGDEAAAQAYLPGIASGQTRAALAVAETAGLWSFDQLATTARPAGDSSASDSSASDGDGGSWRLTGDEAVRAARRDGVYLAHRRRAHRPSGSRLFAVTARHRHDSTLARTSAAANARPHPADGRSHVQRHPGDADRRGLAGARPGPRLTRCSTWR